MIHTWAEYVFPRTTLLSNMIFAEYIAGFCSGSLRGSPA